MTQAAPAGDGRPGRRRRRPGRVLGGVAFALAPWLSLGFGTPIAFIVAAVLFSGLGKVHAAVLWLSAAVYTAALIIGVSASDAASGTSGDHVFIACLLITVVVGGLQALAFTIVAGVKGYRPVRGRAKRDATAEAEPAVRAPAVPAPARPRPFAAAGVPTPIGPNQHTEQQPADTGTHPTAALERRGGTPLPSRPLPPLVIASLVCFALSAAVFVGPVLIAQRAEASHPGSGEGYGFIAVLSIFPCGTGVLLLVVAAAVQLSSKAHR